MKIEPRNFNDTQVTFNRIGWKGKTYQYRGYDYAHNPKALYEANADETALDSRVMDLFKSPVGETSIYKNIPMEYRWNPLIRGMMMSGTYRIKYRGPSKPEFLFTRPQAHTLAEYADTFTIYPR